MRRSRITRAYPLVGAALTMLLAGGTAAAATRSGSASAKGAARHAARSAHSTPKLSGSFAFYSGADTNIENLWTQILIPSFERAYPHVHIDYVYSEHGANDVTTLERVALAEKDHRPSGYALLESATNAVELGARDGLFIPVTSKLIPNSVNVPQEDLSVVKYDAIPYRGSKVVLAYNSNYVKSPPTTLNGIISWIQAHPGQFAYNNPADGGSGQYFVEAVLNKYMPASAVNTLAYHYQPSLENLWAPGMAELHKLGADVYGNGTYPNGNVEVLSLLASGAVHMATVWSDQSLAALRTGGLPKSVKVLDPNPPFAGSPVYLGIPKYTPKNQERLVDAFLNFVLSVPQQAKVVKAVSGFPAIKTNLMTATVKGDFTAIGTTFGEPYAAQVFSDMDRIWQQDVP